MQYEFVWNLFTKHAKKFCGEDKYVVKVKGHVDLQGAGVRGGRNSG